MSSLKMTNSSTARVENSFKQLAAAAQALNHASDDLGKVIRHLDAALKKLGLEITVWVPVSGTSDETQYWGTELGYIKLDGKWCIALREVTGYLQENSDESEQTWSFSEAPRALRAEAVGKIPDLLEKMLQQTEEATRELQEKTEQAAELTFLVSNMVPTPAAPAPQTWHRPAAGSSPQGGQKPSSLPARFRETEPAAATPAAAIPAAAPAPATPPAAPAVPAAAAPAPGAAPAAGANGRFREVEALPGDRTAGTGRVLPTERVS